MMRLPSGASRPVGNHLPLGNALYCVAYDETGMT